MHCGKRGKCSLLAIYPFATMFSKIVCFEGFRMCMHKLILQKLHALRTFINLYSYKKSENEHRCRES